MSTLYKHKDSNVHKTWGLMAAFFVLVIGVGWVLSFSFESRFILIFAIILSVVMSFSSYWWSDKLVLKMTRARPAKEKEYPELHNLVENLSITAGLPKPRIYIIESPAPNAFATGRDPDHAVIGVTEGILKKLERVELEGVLAHEMSHIGNRDILVSTVVVVLSGIVIYTMDILFRSFLWGGIGGDSDSRGGGVTLLIGFAALIIASIFATLLKFAVSRKREYLADASGALLTRYPEGLANALEKISQDDTKMKHANDATAHLFFENPFKADKKKKTSFLKKLFMTHPPVEERISALKNFK